MELPQAVQDIHLYSGSLTGYIILSIILVLINAFLSASELAISSVDQNLLEEKSSDGDIRAKKILLILENQTKFLSVMHLVSTLVSFLNVTLTALLISPRLALYFNKINIPYPLLLAQILVTLILTLVIIIFGELIPRRIAFGNIESFAKFSIGFVSLIIFIFKPIVWFISGITKVFMKILGIETDELDSKITINDIKSLVQLGHSQGVIDKVESEMINSVISFDETYAEEIMTPRTEVFMIDINDEFVNYKDDMMSLKYSRIPVYEDDVDNIKGILYLKDYLLESYSVGFENVDIKKILKPAYFVPERKNINELFSELQTNNKYMALLIDEYGGFAGIVTMEDLIEEIVGNIDDEYDYDEPELIEISDDVYKVVASISIKDFNNQTGSQIDDDSEDYDTIGGFIIYHLGYIPEDGEKPSFDFENLRVEVLEVKDKRIVEAKITVFDEFTHKKEDGENEDK
ncbi:hemolysin family protein [Helcococcus ovis]|uniref:HlyC/CorC family transporter n=1 Tax=Helcococcus ovis TaxID=72026 RepID=A0A4R9C3V1_9FIRM|nr:hemolysin family protein [Helcococcus ovis]TFF64829.1 HlyC/CorC family transporter [Helcococcus ovis]TFF65851.1 HlyC/CorC family transporter [Helcococcus ovis]TFF67813.1 HlyC/CorC family transporter [Helcococcus ovis]WNZ01077.1 hemolysin family protein [Helcococcus ovis]